VKSVQVGFVAADGVIQLGLKGNVVIHVVASANRWPETQADIVVDPIIRARVHILKANKRTNVAQLLGKLGIERRSVEDRIAEMQSGVANDVAPGTIVSGTPAVDHNLWLKYSALLKKLPEIAKAVRAKKA